MTVIFSIIFCLCIAAGWGWGYVNDMDVMGYAICIGTAGFLGSSLIAVIFSWLYFFQKETDKEKIQRLQAQINEIQEVKKIGP